MSYVNKPDLHVYTGPSTIDGKSVVGEYTNYTNIAALLANAVATANLYPGHRVADNQTGRIYKLKYTGSSNGWPYTSEELTYEYDDNHRTFTGSGRPTDNSVGLPDDNYIDLVTGDVYIKDAVEGDDFGEWSVTPDLDFSSLVTGSISDITVGGTANQIVVSDTSPDYVVSLSSTLLTPGTLTTGGNFQVGNSLAAKTSKLYGDITAYHETGTILNLDVSTGLLALTGRATISSTLGVTGATTITGLTSADGGIDVNGGNLTVGITGATYTASTLDVDGLASLDGGIDVNGAEFSVDTDGTTVIKGNTTVQGALLYAKTLGGSTTFSVDGADGTTSILGDVTIGDASEIILNSGTGTIEAKGNLEADGAISVGGFAKAGVTSAVPGASYLLDLSGGNTFYLKETAEATVSIGLHADNDSMPELAAFIGGSFIVTVVNGTGSSMDVSFDNALFNTVNGDTITLANGEALTYSGIINGSGETDCAFYGVIAPAAQNLMV